MKKAILKELLEDCLSALGGDPYPGEWGLPDSQREKPKLRKRLREALKELK